MLHLKEEEVDTPEKRGKIRLNVVGCGQKGVFYALAFAEAGFKVSCTDVDQSAVKRLSTGSLPFGDRQAEVKLKSLLKKGVLNVTGDFDAAVSESDVTIITVDAKVDSKKRVDNASVVGICKKVGKNLQRGSLVVYGGVGGVGFVEGVVKESLEDTSGFKSGDLGVAYNPTFSYFWNCEKRSSVQQAVVAANDKYSLNSAALIFETITEKGVEKTFNIKKAEAAVLFAAAKRDINMALNNELAVFCEKTDLDFVETAELFDSFSCPNSCRASIAEEANREEVYVLLENADNVNMQLRLPKMARQLNEDMVKHAFNLTQDALRVGGKTMRRANIALLGAAETGTAAEAFAELLVAKGAKISRYNPQGTVDPKAEGTLKRTLNETVEGANCLVILSEIEQFKRLSLKKLHALMKEPSAFVDLVGVIEPTKVMNTGFTYRGLGRGEQKK
ncbi:MAG: UDP binding domain-containing protein [Candidatus Bathyarchaeia archaeon]